MWKKSSHVIRNWGRAEFFQLPSTLGKYVVIIIIIKAESVVLPALPVFAWHREEQKCLENLPC